MPCKALRFGHNGFSRGGAPKFRAGCQFILSFYDGSDLTFTFTINRPCKNAAGYSVSEKRVKLPTIKFRTAYKWRKFGLLKAYGMQNRCLWAWLK